MEFRSRSFNQYHTHETEISRCEPNETAYIIADAETGEYYEVYDNIADARSDMETSVNCVLIRVDHPVFYYQDPDNHEWDLMPIQWYPYYYFYNHIIIR